MGYKSTNPEVFKKNLATSQTRPTGRTEFWKPQVGKAGAPVRNVIRIMPMHENMSDVIVETKMHFNLGPKADQTARCLGPYGQECPACTEVDKLYKAAKATTDPAQAANLKEKAGDMRGQLRFYANIVDDNHPETGVQTYGFGVEEEKDLRLCFQDDDQEFRDIADPKAGRDVIVLADYHPTKQFKGKPVRQLTFKAKENASPLKDMSWLDNIQDLSVYLTAPTRSDVMNALAGSDTRSYTGQNAAKPAVSVSGTSAPAGTTPGKPLTAPATPTAAKKAPVQRKPVTEAAPADPYAPARAALAAIKVTPIEVTPEEVPALLPGVPCFAPMLIEQGVEPVTDPTDKGCAGCRLLLPCLTAKVA